jgi:predicted DNA-binding transcriptional regulator YafY
MRADRLLALLMHLQTQRRMTAQQLAQELEVSERTIYRDVVALSSAGIPIYTESGPGGGIALLDDYQTDLTGLHPEEVQALAMLEIPEALERLGAGQALKAALLKLAAAIPPSLREQQVQTQNRIHLDATAWFEADEATPHLQTIKQAVFEDRQLKITYQGDFNITGEQVVSPYGLVAKASIWHLVYAFGSQMRVRRIAHIIEAELFTHQFMRLADFDLAGFWQSWCSAYENDRPIYRVQALVAPSLAERLPLLLENNQPDTLNTPPTTPQVGWQAMTLDFGSFEAARTQLLGFGGAIEVLEPLALRQSLADFAYQIQKLYGAVSS